MEPTGAGRIHWDEEGIREHDKVRGLTEKITEPKTPYHYYDEEEDKEEVAQEAPVDQEDLESELEKVRKKQEFLEKRRAHYNEFQMVRQMKQRQLDEDPDDEDS